MSINDHSGDASSRKAGPSNPGETYRVGLSSASNVSGPGAASLKQALCQPSVEQLILQKQGSTPQQRPIMPLSMEEVPTPKKGRDFAEKRTFGVVAGYAERLDAVSQRLLALIELMPSAELKELAAETASDAIELAFAGQLRPVTIEFYQCAFDDAREGKAAAGRVGLLF